MWRPQEAAQCEPWPDILARATRPRALTGLSRSSRWNGLPCLLPGATGRHVATTCRPPWVISISTVSIIDVGASDLDLPRGSQHGASPAIDQKPQSRLRTSLPFRCRSPVLRTRNGRSCAAWSWSLNILRIKQNHKPGKEKNKVRRTPSPIHVTRTQAQTTTRNRGPLAHAVRMQQHVVSSRETHASQVKRRINTTQN